MHGFLHKDGSQIHAALSKELCRIDAIGGSHNGPREIGRKKKNRFYESLLATLDIQVQAYVSSCTHYATEAEAIESSLLKFDPIKQNLRLQNISGPVFPDTQSPGTGGLKRPAKGRGVVAGTIPKSKPVANSNPHPSLALTS
jgi:hypothetical protein